MFAPSRMQKYHFLALRAFALGVLTLLAAHFSIGSADAQILSRGDLFGPGAPPPLLGPEVGFGANSQIGSFNALCNCEFAEGKGAAFLLGGLYELPLDYNWAIGAKLNYNSRRTTSNVIKREKSVLTSIANDSSFTGTITFERVGNVVTNYATIVPYVRYAFYRNGPFVAIGPSIGYLLSGTFKHSRVLQSNIATLEDGSTQKDIHFPSGTDEETLEEGKIHDVQKLRLGALFTVGYDIEMSDRSILAPQFSYDLPLNVLRNNGNAANDWKMASIFASVTLKFKMD